MAETLYPTTKHSLGDAVCALGWYRQFRDRELESIQYSSPYHDRLETFCTPDLCDENTVIW